MDLNLINSQKSFEKGKLLHQKRDYENAISEYEQAIKLNPRNAQALNNLGALLMQQHGMSKYEESKKYVLQAIQLKPGEATFRHSLGNIYKHAGKLNLAADAFARAVDKRPNELKFLLDYAGVLKQLKKYSKASEICGKIYSLNPGSQSKYLYHKAMCQRWAGNAQAAICSFRQYLQFHPEDQKAQFWLAVSQKDTAKFQACPSQIVASLFDSYAQNFDTHLLSSLKYLTPQLLNQLIQRFCTNCYFDAGIDLGCGTGLMGAYIRPYCKNLQGVDLSPQMINQAEEKNCYDELIVGEAVNFLKSCKGQTCGIIVAADVLVYIGNLEELFVECGRVLETDGYFLFSTERGNCDENEFELQQTGRFCHGNNYVKQLVENLRLSLICVEEEIIRYNAGQPVKGCLYVVQKSIL